MDVNGFVVDEASWPRDDAPCSPGDARVRCWSDPASALPSPRVEFWRAVRRGLIVGFIIGNIVGLPIFAVLLIGRALGWW